MIRTLPGRWVILGLLAAGFGILVSYGDLWESVLTAFFPNEERVLHPRASLPVFIWEHLRIVAIAGAFTIAIGVPLGIWVTRPSGRHFLPLASDFTSVAQTFPPVAVLALAVPALGFGLKPTVVALFLYGLLPVVRNTVAGIRSVPAGAVDAAVGLGMSRTTVLLRVELPLAAGVILTGVRITVVIIIGTAMIGAAIGAGGLGSPVIAGLVQNNLAFVLEGAIPAAALALLADQALANLEALFDYPRRSE